MKISKEVIYICEKCGSRYNNEDEAIKCEESHTAIDKVSPLYYAGSKYPYDIDVKFADGRSKTYGLIT